MKKSRILIVVSIIIALILVIGGGIWLGKRASSPKNSPPKPNSNSQKDLAEKIKTDLKERAERLKNGSRSMEDTIPYTFDKKKIVRAFGNLDFIKEGEEVSSADIGEENFQEIMNLIRKLPPAKKEWEEKKRQEAQEKADANPNLFYFPGKGSFVGGILTDETSHWQFYGRQDKKEYLLTIPVLHPDLAGISFKSDNWDIYHITGVENIPLVLWKTGWLRKIAKLDTSPITIKLQT